MARPRPLNAFKRQSLLDAASVLFLEKGFDGTSIEEIARQAEVSKVTAYKHFTSKCELFRTVATTWIVLLETKFNHLDYAVHDERSLISALLEIHKFISAPLFVRIERRLASEIDRCPELGEAYLEATWRRFQWELVGFLGGFSQFRQRGLPARQIAAEHLLSMIVGMGGLGRRFGQEELHEDVQKRVSGAVRTLFRSCPKSGKAVCHKGFFDRALMGEKPFD